MCHICAKRPAISREHLPPQSAGNWGTLEVRFIDGYLDHGIQHQYTQFDNGFWLHSLCSKCNNHTGARYGTAYADFISQLSASLRLEDVQGRSLVNLRNIYPLRVLKQMFAMFLCAMPQTQTPMWQNIRHFVRRRDSTLPNDAPRIYLYHNTSVIGRIVPWCAIRVIYCEATSSSLWNYLAAFGNCFWRRHPWSTCNNGRNNSLGTLPIPRKN